MVAGPDAANKPAAKKFSWKEIAKHTTAESAWLSIRGQVFDVTKLLDRHPGGRDALLSGAGRDCTQVFETYHAFDFKGKQDYFNKYYIGEVEDIEECCPTFPDPGPFFLEVKKEVYGYFEKSKQDPKNPPWMWVRYFNIVATFLTCWYLQWFVLENFFVRFVLAVLQGWCGALIGLMPLHDSSHFAITHNPLVWRLIGNLHDFLNGASYRVWLYQHTFGHHPYTNIDGCDPDVETSEADFRRIKESQKWHRFYIPQHYYVPLMYCFLAAKTRVQDITLTLSGMNGSVRMNQPTPSHWFQLLGGKAFFFFYRFAIPLLAGHDFKTVFILFNAADFMTSYWLALTFQANHVVEHVKWPVPDENHHMKDDWAVHQVITCQDYSHHSWFWNVFSGALNHQTTHHLFPEINQFYYPEISPIVQRLCKKHKVQYFYRNSFSSALGSHLKHMKNLGADAPERWGKKSTRTVSKKD